MLGPWSLYHKEIFTFTAAGGMEQDVHTHAPINASWLFQPFTYIDAQFQAELLDYAWSK